MEPEKNTINNKDVISPYAAKPQNNNADSSSSSSKSIDPADPLAEENEYPKQYGEEDANRGFNHDLERYETNSSQLSRVISHPDNIRRLESLTRVLSSRRLSVPGAPLAPLAVDPNDFDLRVLLQGISQRLDTQGVTRKYTGVSLTEVTSWGIDATTAFGPSVGEILRAIATIPKHILSFKKQKVRPIIRNVNGLIREGELLLVLGRPGSGCTSFLRTVAGEIDQFTNVEGEFSYSGASQKDMLNHFKSEVIYNPERMYLSINQLIILLFIIVFFSF